MEPTPRSRTSAAAAARTSRVLISCPIHFLCTFARIVARDLFIRRAVAQQPFDVGLLDRKQAVPQLAIAVSRSRLQFRQNGRVTDATNPTVPTAIGEPVLRRRRARIAIRNLDPTARSRATAISIISFAVSTLSRGHKPCASSGMNSMYRISMPCSRPNRDQRHDVRLHQVLHRHRVDLDGPETQAAARRPAPPALVATRRAA